jgi:hypothetical protein
LANAIFGLVALLTFCMGIALGEQREHRRGVALWSQYTADAVARSVKSDRN